VPTTWTETFAVNQAVPDGNLTGLVDSRNLVLPDAEILSLSIRLELSPRGEGGFVGDLYVTLQHDGGGYAVLLNRPGRRPDAPFGYSDDVGIQIDLSDEALADIHQYRLALNGDESQPIDSPLSGFWQADGRSTDPLEVGPDDPRDANLNSFIGTLPSGGWTLFVSDVSAGGTFQLDAWSVSVTLVPEPTVPVLVLFGAGLLFLRHRRSPPES
jgi:subtilisin-like proprotein convertase family protein